MLTGKQVRVRYARDRILPYYLDTSDPVWREVAERLLLLFSSQEGRSRGELEAELAETFGSDPSQLVHQGLAKLLEDRCEFEVASGQPPQQVRETVFRLAAEQRRFLDSAFDRDAVLHAAGTALTLAAAEVQHALFADLKSEQRLVRFKTTTPERLLERYNVALAQAVLLRATSVHVEIRNEPPARYRQLFRQVKFHRLVCELEAAGEDALRFRLDGPLSLFAATQKYGMQLALFLPALLHCRDFSLQAELRWGPQRKPKRFLLDSGDGLVSPTPDTGTYVPAELRMFAELFRKKISEWDLQDETGAYLLGEGTSLSYWVPDFRLVQRKTGHSLLLEVLGFWRRASAEKHLQQLRKYATEPFLLAVSDQLRVDDTDLEGLPAGIHRFRQMPLPDEIARLAEGVMAHQPPR
jgi:predicted nuclease of restriction endonuclease-like RecB superfamily